MNMQLSSQALLLERETSALVQAFNETRDTTELICKPLEVEDYGLQGADFASPPKWHLAHTSWFFETFLLRPLLGGYKCFHPAFETLFNSYYNGVGEQFPRPERGLLSRPSVAEVYDYRQYVNRAMHELLSQRGHGQWTTIAERCLLGIQHEKQHQELLLTDIKYSLYKNPLLPAYQKLAPPVDIDIDIQPQCWRDYQGGLVTVGVDPQSESFYFDNEAPAHQVFLAPFSLSNRLVTNAEYQAFVDDGGYQRSELWLSDGWATVQKHRWRQPLYWREQRGRAMEYGLHGLVERRPQQAVIHLSLYEADAFANWAGARLPSEFEWEFAASQQRLVESPVAGLQPRVASGDQPLLQLQDSAWQWTASSYRPYPGFTIADGAMGEYNGKFMCNQWVLRGGSCVSSAHHLRRSYRNFFYPEDRWQFSGIRLAKKQ